MAIALVTGTNVSTGLGANGGTTAGINTTGADLLVVGINQFQGTIQTLTDSKSNTWTQLTLRQGTDPRSVLFYAKNATVDSSHTFTYTGTTIYPVLNVMAFSGSDLSAPFDAENGNNGSGTSLATNSCAVNNAGEVVVANLCTTAAITGLNIGSSFTGLVSTAYSAGNNIGGAMAYKIASSAENPSWGWTTSVPGATGIASFKAAAAGGSTRLVKMAGRWGGYAGASGGFAA